MSEEEMLKLDNFLRTLIHQVMPVLFNVVTITCNDNGIVLNQENDVKVSLGIWSNPIGYGFTAEHYYINDGNNEVSASSFGNATPDEDSSLDTDFPKLSYSKTDKAEAITIKKSRVTTGIVKLKKGVNTVGFDRMGILKSAESINDTSEPDKMFDVFFSVLKKNESKIFNAIKSSYIEHGVTLRSPYNSESITLSIYFELNKEVAGEKIGMGTQLEYYPDREG